MYYCYVWGYKIKHLWDEMFFQHDFMMFSLKKDKSSPWHHLFEITCYLVPESLPWEDKHKIVLAAKSLQSCPTVWLHRWQPSRLPCPWDSPGKNTEVGCHFILQCMKVKSESDRVWFLATPWTAAYQSPPSMVFSWQEYWSGLPLPSLRSRNLLQE